MLVVPDSYSNIGLSKGEKILVNSIKNKYDDRNLILLNIYPIDKEKKSVLLINGQACFCNEVTLNEVKLLPMLLLAQVDVYKSDFDTIKHKLLKYREFNKNGELSVSINFKYYYSEIKRQDLVELSLTDVMKRFVEENCIFKDDILRSKSLPKEQDIFINSCESDAFDKIEGNKLNTFIHIIAPEYTIPIYNKLDNTSSVVIDSVNQTYVRKHEEYNINEENLVTKVLFLDKEQINIVNQIKSGNQLILACAGSGKSVLLLSKCFKIASLHSDKKFLLTCYNRNLNDMYRWRANIAGFRERNVECFTFHKLCMNLLDEINVSYDINKLDELFYLTKKYLDEGKIKRRYFGIFIDEVQVFNSEWYELCYKLLESHDEDKHFFIICGDKSQNLYKNMKAGKAPWQGGKGLPDYRGKSIRIEKNYRNTVQINNYINRFTECSKNKIKGLDIEINKDTDYILRGKAFKQGEDVKVIVDNKNNEVKNIVSIINKLHKDKDVEFTDIAIIMHKKKYTIKSKNVYPINYYLLKALEESRIPYSELSPDNFTDRTSYGHRDGVTISTIESALGLDFRAVIICGLEYMGAYYKSSKEYNVLS